MNILKLLNLANVPESFHASAIDSIERAEYMKKGLALAKWKVRLFKAKKISELLSWEDERLFDVVPSFALWDIAPMINITAHGDNVPWPYGIPRPGQWLNKDPESDEYKQAVQSNYWCPGEHPRSRKSREVWYRRNGGEYDAYARGAKVPIGQKMSVWKNNGLVVSMVDNVWLINGTHKLWGLIPMKIRVGYEIDNVLTPEGKQKWFPIKDHDLRAPVTWYHLPSL